MAWTNSKIFTAYIHDVLTNLTAMDLDTDAVFNAALFDNTVTPSQTVGPFFAIGLGDAVKAELVDPSDPDAVRLSGVVLDGEGEPVVDAQTPPRLISAREA